jgi:acyl-coenzyme A thioesterase PaaI-like protein
MENKGKELSIQKMRWFLFLLGITKIPMIAYLRPKLLLVNDDDAVVKIKLRRRSKNHLKSMYFGALAVGADIAGGLHAFYFAEKMGQKVSFAFKSMKADFLKRAESDIIFKSTEGRLVEKAMHKSYTDGERVNQAIKIEAINSDKEVVATFELIVSVRVK